MAGKFFEELPVGATFRHQPSRTVTETDNLLVTTLTMNTQSLHLDDEFAKGTEFGKPLVNSMFTLALVVGLSVSDTTLGTTIGNLGMTDVNFPLPLFDGDTIRCTTEVLGKRESKSRPGAGIVELHHRAYNQHGKLVAECKRQAFMRMRPR